MNDQTETLVEAVKDGVEVAANTALVTSSQPVAGGNAVLKGLKYVGTALVGVTIGFATYFGVKKVKARKAKKAAEKDAKKVEEKTTQNPKPAQTNAD